jgi:hypothetical protein
MTPIVSFLSAAAAEIAARRPARPDPIISISCEIVLISDTYMALLYLPFRKAANSHIYLELLQLLAIWQKAINCCIHAVIVLSIICDILDQVVI